MILNSDVAILFTRSLRACLGSRRGWMLASDFRHPARKAQAILCVLTSIFAPDGGKLA